jgi:hypothetical protein
LTTNCREDLDDLENWANDKGYFVNFTKDGDDSICYISKMIEINSSSSLEKQVMRLLHECGHVLIFENGGTYSFENVKDDDGKLTHDERTLRVIEEIEAWGRGFKLAKRLSIKLDKEKWEKSVVDAIGKYINWAVKGDSDGKD